MLSLTVMGTSGFMSLTRNMHNLTFGKIKMQRNNVKFKKRSKFDETQH